VPSGLCDQQPAGCHPIITRKPLDAEQTEMISPAAPTFVAVEITGSAKNMAPPSTKFGLSGALSGVLRKSSTFPETGSGLREIERLHQIVPGRRIPNTQKMERKRLHWPKWRPRQSHWLANRTCICSRRKPEVRSTNCHISERSSKHEGHSKK